MAVRTSERIVRFRHPFTLKNVDRRLPAGEYRILGDEESIEGLSFLAFRTTALSMLVPMAGALRDGKDTTSSTEMISIGSAELELALESDRQDGLADPGP